ncbi:MAG: hypothetical protein K1X78_02600 [Verrucomicrobiaceae bacterium]|nr:hypothetical protein [Verrucomicrobiaceae bacterium]
MKPKSQIIRITLCAPGDVSKEVTILEQVIAEWNHLHWDATNCGIKSRHWRADATPDMSDRPQGIINQQLIDDADLIVAVFWSRFGTPTGKASSGTEEEVRRAIAAKTRVFLYFSDLEPLPSDVDEAQLARLHRFREEMQPSGLAWRFRSRAQLRSEFGKHLAKYMDEKLAKRGGTKARRKPTASAINQSGSGNTQVVGDHNTIYQKPPVIRQVVPLPEGSITPDEQKQITEWIEELAEFTTGKTRGEAFAMWWKRLTKKCKVAKYQQILSIEMPELERWHKTQLVILKSERKTSAPEMWRNDRITAIKASMGRMGRSKEDYYPELSDRLNMKRAFTSLKKLTKTDLERVYRMVMSDARKTA